MRTQGRGGVKNGQIVRMSFMDGPFKGTGKNRLRAGEEQPKNCRSVNSRMVIG